MNEPKEVYASNYIQLFDDGTICISDGVGYVDTMAKEEVNELRNALNKQMWEDIAKPENKSTPLSQKDLIGRWDCMRPETHDELTHHEPETLDVFFQGRGGGKQSGHDAFKRKNNV